MTPDEIQRLMSGYATGSLTESERKLLFEAALEDQDLFDQLAREQALKELIDQPGARDRLIAALAPAETSRASGAWKKPLAWGLAAMFVVSMSVAALMLTRAGDQREQAEKQIAQKKIGEPQIAQVNPPAGSPPAPAMAAPGSAAPFDSGSATSPPPKQMRERRSTASANARGDLDAAVRARPNAQAPAKSQTVDGQGAGDKLAPVPATKKEGRANARASSGANSGAISTGAAGTATASPGTAPSPARSPSRVQPVGQAQMAGQIAQPPAVQAQGFVAGQSQGVPQAAPVRPPAQLTTGQLSNSRVPDAQAQNGQLQSASDSIGQVQTARKQVQVQTGQNQGQSGGGGGGGAGVGGAAGGRVARAPASAPAHFAFDYAIDGEDLVFKFSADGYFSLHIAPGGLTIVDARVTAGSTRREHITGNGTEATIVFSASPQSAVQGVSIDTRARSGTAEDPGGERIDLLMRFY